MADEINANGWRRSILRVVLAYAFFAALWILLSDQAIGWVFRDPDLLVKAAMFKGWVFVAVTSLLLYGLLQRSWIRHHRELEGRLRALKLLESIAESSDDAIFAKDEHGRYLLFNRAASRFVGIPAAEVLGKDDRALFPPEQAEALLDFSRRVMEEDRSICEEEVLDTPDGRKTFLATKGPLRDADGQVIGVFGLSRDVTERKRAEQELRESEARFRTLFESPAVSVFVHDRDTGGILEVNQGALAMFGCPDLEALASKPFAPPPYSCEEAVALVRKAAREGPQRFEWMSCKLDGSPVWQDIDLQPIVLDGVERVLAVTHDITARKAAEAELRERNAELERFNRATVGRELVMVEMKGAINALSRETGREPPYPLAFLDGRGDVRP